MSVRAYRITNIEWEDDPTFNLWRDEWIMDNIHIRGLDEDGGGLGTVYLNDVKDAIKKLEEEIAENEDKQPTEDQTYYMDALKKMVEQAGDSEEIQYMCY